MKVYTKTGDGGTPMLIGGERVSKADTRVEAYGTVDELAAHLAMLSDMMRSESRFTEMVAAVDDIQRDLMVVEALLATGAKGEGKVAPLPESAVERMERQIDEMSEGLPPLKGFVIPGGHPIVSQSHICRTVCRRAERATVRLSEEHPLPSGPARYLNRLSDWLYVAGRKVVVILEIKEIYWTV
jgi:cob(I)alamin adenosyltransferase